MSGARAETLLSLRDVCVEYGSRGKTRFDAVRHVSLDLDPGKILGLVGESGAGKSSVASAVLRLHPLKSGSVRFRGQDLSETGASETQRRIQAVFQDPFAALSPRRTVRQSLSEPLNHFRIGDGTHREMMIARTMAEVGLETCLLERLPNELSGGQRQRVALARALVCEPDLVVADEPVSSLDVPTQKRIADLILELRDKLGVAFLFISHDIGVVRRLADHVAVMYAGRIVEQGPAGNLFDQPAHPYTRALMRAVPIADPARPSPLALDSGPPAALTPAAGCVFHTRCNEAMAECRASQPQEQAVGNANSSPAGHTTRCHLWNR